MLNVVPRLELVVDSAEETDADLVAAVRAGDRAAASRLYARHAVRVRGLLARIVGTGAELDDLLQDTFVVALRRLDALRDPHALGPWLRSVAVGEARHHLRAKARRRWLLFFAPVDLPEPRSTHVEPLPPELRASVQTTLAIVRELPVDERVAFALRYFEGLQLDEAAEATGVSLATFKRRLLRAETRFHDRARAYPDLDALKGER